MIYFQRFSAVSGSTNGAGEITFTSKQVKNGGTFTFTVNSVAEPWHVYAPGDNVETTDSVTAP